MKIKVYRIILYVLESLLISSSIALLTLSIIDCINTSADVFDAIMYVICFLIVIAFSILQIINTIMSTKGQNSYLNSLLYEENDKIIQGLYAGFIVFLLIGIGIIVYSSLLIMNLNLPLNEFALPIKYVILDFGLLLLIDCLLVILYPLTKKE